MLSRSSRGGVPVFRRPHSKPTTSAIRQARATGLAGASRRCARACAPTRSRTCGRDNQCAARGRVALLRVPGDDTPLVARSGRPADQPLDVRLARAPPHPLTVDFLSAWPSSTTPPDRTPIEQLEMNPVASTVGPSSTSASISRTVALGRPPTAGCTACAHSVGRQRAQPRRERRGEPRHGPLRTQRGPRDDDDVDALFIEVGVSVSELGVGVLRWLLPMQNRGRCARAILGARRPLTSSSAARASDKSASTNSSDIERLRQAAARARHRASCARSTSAMCRTWGSPPIAQQVDIGPRRSSASRRPVPRLSSPTPNHGIISQAAGRSALLRQ